MKLQSRESGYYNDCITLKFGRHLVNAAAQVPVKFQSNWRSLNSNLAAPRLHEIFGKTSVYLVNRGPCFRQAISRHDIDFINLPCFCFPWEGILTACVLTSNEKMPTALKCKYSAYLFRLTTSKLSIYCQLKKQQKKHNEDECCISAGVVSLQWRHNGCDCISNHQPHNCLLKRLFRRRWKKTSKLRVTGLCVGNSPETCEFPAQMASNAENVSIWWRHHVIFYHQLLSFH